MTIKKIIFLGSKPIGFNCLKFLISQQSSLNAEISGILTNQRKEFGEDSDLCALATENRIRIYAQPDDIPECDIIYSVQYHKILQKEQIKRARIAAVNLHMAPLPEFRGSNQFSFALIDQKTEFGATIHKIDHRIDHGDILFQKRFPIPENCWVGDLYKLTYDASLQLFKETLAALIQQDYTPVAQDVLTAAYGTSLHFRREMAIIKQIDLSWEREKIERYVRATSMPGFEPPYCTIDGEKVFFSRKPNDI